ncbi:MAG: hypothetical protein MAG715_00832 [Methanonatronarchaeales archaeon]|nr:hypothetical protein [Methanonatronarchaeales archaeon]
MVGEWSPSGDEPVGNESTRQLLVRGFRVWSNNLKIAVPFALSLLTIVAWIASGLLVFLLLNPPPESLLSASQSAVYDPALLASLLGGYAERSSTTLAVLVPLWLAGAMLISALFDAAAIGMSVEANELYRCSLQDAARYGKKHLLDMFLAEALMLLIVAALMVAFLSPVLLSDPALLLAREPDPALLVPIGALLFFAYLFIPVRYALVCDDLGPVDAVVTGTTFTMGDPLAVLLLLVAVALVSVAVNLPGAIVGGAGTTSAVAVEQLYGLAASVLVTGPYSSVLWTRIYLDRTGARLVESDQPR